jgi:hypothetical protein
MSYTPPYIPRADSAFRDWANWFCNGTSRDHARFMLTPAQSQALMRQFLAFDEAYVRATEDITRTPSAIVTKDDARSVLQHSIQQYAALIRSNDGIADDDKINIGVRPRNVAHTRRTCPNVAPLLIYLGSIPGVDVLSYRNAANDSKAKPRGAERLELWVAYSRPGEAGVGGPKVSQARLVGSFKKSKMLVDQDPQRDSRMEGDGKPTYWARWVGFDGAAGPWSLACRPSLFKKQEPKKKVDKKANSAGADDQSLAPRMAA